MSENKREPKTAEEWKAAYEAQVDFSKSAYHRGLKDGQRALERVKVVAKRFEDYRFPRDDRTAGEDNVAVEVCEEIDIEIEKLGGKG